jgi:hypothetical protein
VRWRIYSDAAEEYGDAGKMGVKRRKTSGSETEEHDKSKSKNEPMRGLYTHLENPPACKLKRNASSMVLTRLFSFLCTTTYTMRDPKDPRLSHVEIYPPGLSGISHVRFRQGRLQ